MATFLKVLWKLKLMSEIKTNFDMAINMIKSGEAEQSIIDEENK